MKLPYLTQKQELFIYHYNRGLNGTQAAKLAYNTTSDNVAAVMASQNLRKLKVTQALTAIRVDSGVLLDDAIQVLGEGMRANKYVRGIETDVPDLKIRLRASAKALHLIELSCLA